MPRKILIIDNDEDILDVLQEALNYEGFEVVTAMDADDILSAVQHHQPDLLMIDYLLNGINGGELCSQIKKNEATCNLPVVIISAYPRVLQSLGTYNCNAFIPKPFDLNDLTHTLTRLIA
ncbi:response regulator [Mucilaginibacter koreensis]